MENSDFVRQWTKFGQLVGKLDLSFNDGNRLIEEILETIAEMRVTNSLPTTKKVDSTYWHFRPKDLKAAQSQEFTVNVDWIDGTFPSFAIQVSRLSGFDKYFDLTISV